MKGSDHPRGGYLTQCAGKLKCEAKTRLAKPAVWLCEDCERWFAPKSTPPVK